MKIAEMAEAGLGASATSHSDLNDRALILPQGTVISCIFQIGDQ